MKIEAFAVKESGRKPEPFIYEKKVGKNDVLIRITHCSLTAGDVQMMNDAWGDSKFPLVAGHEIIGVVEQTGSNVHDLKIGDRVGVGYQLEACFKCECCKEGNEQFCTKQKVVAVDYYGGLAKHIMVDRRFAFKISRRLDAATTAPLLSSGLTVYSAIMRGNLPKKAQVAVLGIGGLGHLAIQFLHKMGHDVSAFSRSHDKREMIEKLGGKFVDSSNLMTMQPSSENMILSCLLSM